MPNNPLHNAVINNDLHAIPLLQEQIDSYDDYGFTPIEIAKLLNRKECLQLLSPTPTPFFKVVDQNEHIAKKLTESQLENHLNFTHIHQPHIDSYTDLINLIDDCPWLLANTSLGNEAKQLGEQYREQLFSRLPIEVIICWIDPTLQYGLIAAENIPKGTFIGSYAGHIRRLYRRKPDPNGYCFHYPTRHFSWRYRVIDAQKEGNLLRFLNHNDNPNLEPKWLLDRGLLHLGLFSTETIGPGMQLTFNYGNDYWIKRQKA